MAIQTKSLGGDSVVSWSYDWQDNAPAHVVSLQCVNNGQTAIYGQLKHDADGLFVDGFFQPGTSTLPVPTTPAANRFDLVIDPRHGPTGVTLITNTQN